jgi:hypothetical protein
MIALRQLNLTQSQKDQIKVYVTAGRTVAKQIREDNSLTAPQRRERQTLNAKSTREKVLGVLTPAQRVKLTRIARADANWRNVLARLNLAPRQKQAIRGYLTDAASAVKGVRGNQALTAEQKRSEMLQIRKDTRGKILATLTPQQRRKALSLLNGAPKRV